MCLVCRLATLPQPRGVQGECVRNEFAARADDISAACDGPIMGITVERVS